MKKEMGLILTGGVFITKPEDKGTIFPRDQG